LAILQATRALRKGFEAAIYFYGPGSLNCLATRGFPTTGNAAFPGELNINDQLKTFIAKAARSTAAVRPVAARRPRGGPDRRRDPTHPLDVQDALIHYARKGAIINSTYMF